MIELKKRIFEDKNNLTREDVKTLFRYDSKTGALYHKYRDKSFFLDEKDYRIWNKKHKNKLITSVFKSGYLRVGIFGVTYRQHRLVWLLHTGKWPLDQIDHINGIKNDNRIENLRECNKYENMANQNKVRGVIPLKGVSKHNGGRQFKSAIRHNGETIFLGSFKTPEEAHNAYMKAALELKGEFCAKNLRL